MALKVSEFLKSDQGHNFLVISKDFKVFIIIKELFYQHSPQHI